MKRKKLIIAIFLTALAIVGTALFCHSHEETHTSEPLLFYNEYLEACQTSYADAVSYVYFENNWEIDSYIANGRDRLLQYRILEGPTEINESLYVLKCEFETETNRIMGNKTVAYNFIAKIDGKYKVITNSRNIPSALRQNFNEDQYRNTDENEVSVDDLLGLQ